MDDTISDAIEGGEYDMMTLRILVGIAMGLTLINFGINIFILRKLKLHELRWDNQISQGGQAGGIVVCHKCNNRYSITSRKCPFCGTVRK